jgi:hypothetical protein
MHNSKYKSIVFNTLKYIGITIVVILSLMYRTLFFKRIKQEIKKVANIELTLKVLGKY